MALAMVDIALWDLAAQRAEVPLWRMLGGTSDAIEAYNTDGGWLNLSERDLVRDLQSLVDQGWRRVKIKVGKSDWREDAGRVRAVRRAIGDDVTLMCDANQRWDLATASRMLPVLEEVRMDWVEEPLHADDLDGHARLQRATSLDIAAGESIYSYQQFTGFIAADAFRVVQVDATRVGGVTEWLQVASHAAARALSESPALVEFIPWTREAFVERSIVREGYVERPHAPGASTAIDPTARERWQIPGVGGTRTKD